MLLKLTQTSEGGQRNILDSKEFLVLTHTIKALTIALRKFLSQDGIGFGDGRRLLFFHMKVKRF
jgi:effector-binding domain-containing protein